MVFVGSPSSADDHSDLHSLQWPSSYGGDGHSSPATSPRSPARSLYAAADLVPPPASGPGEPVRHRAPTLSYARELVSRSTLGNGTDEGSTNSASVFRRGSGSGRWVHREGGGGSVAFCCVFLWVSLPNAWHSAAVAPDFRRREPHAWASCIFVHPPVQCARACECVVSSALPCGSALGWVAVSLCALCANTSPRPCLHPAPPPTRTPTRTCAVENIVLVALRSSRLLLGLECCGTSAVR